MAKRIGVVLVVLGVVASLSLVPTAAMADTLNWTIAATGTIAYQGGSGALSGNNIGVTSVQDTTTGVSFNIIGGALNFTSGAGNGPWSWGAGAPGSLTLSGCISGLTGNGNCGTAGGFVNLLSDDFTSATIFQTFAGSSYQVQLGNITGTLDSSLTGQNGFGVQSIISSALYNTTVNVNGAALGAAFNGFNLGGTINSTAAAAPVPEPSSATLLGFGLFGLLLATGTRSRLLVS